MSAAEKCIELADALRGLLEPAVVDVGGTIDRDYVPRYDVKDLDRKIKATVIPRTVETERKSRTDWQDDLNVDIAVQKRTKTRIENDRLVKITGDLAEVLKETPNPLDDVVLLTVKVDPVYSPEHLDQKKVFTSVLRATYRYVS